MYKSPDGYRYLCLMNVNDPRIHVIIRNLISQAVGEMGLKRAIVKNCQEIQTIKKHRTQKQSQ